MAWDDLTIASIGSATRGVNSMFGFTSCTNAWRVARRGIHMRSDSCVIMLSCAECGRWCYRYGRSLGRSVFACSGKYWASRELNRGWSLVGAEG